MSLRSRVKALFRIVVDELPPIRTNHDVDIQLRERDAREFYVHMNICLDIWPYCSTDPANTSHHLYSNGTCDRPFSRFETNRVFAQIFFGHPPRGAQKK